MKRNPANIIIIIIIIINTTTTNNPRSFSSCSNVIGLLKGVAGFHGNGQTNKKRRQNQTAFFRSTECTGDCIICRRKK